MHSSMVATYKRASNRFYLLVFTALWCFLSHEIWLTYGTMEYCRVNNMWFLRLSHKRYCIFYFSLSWITCCGESQPPCQEDTQAAGREVQEVRNWGLQPMPSGVSHLESWSFSPSQALRYTVVLVSPQLQPYEIPQARTAKLLLNSQSEEAER